jgi:hypothetical protein
MFLVLAVRIWDHLPGSGIAERGNPPIVALGLGTAVVTTEWLFPDRLILTAPAK